MNKSLLFLAFTLPVFAQNKTLTVPQQVLAQASAYKGMQPGTDENYISLPGTNATEAETEPNITIKAVSEPVRHETWNDHKFGIVAKFRWPTKDIWLGIQAVKGRLGKEASIVFSWRF